MNRLTVLSLLGALLLATIGVLVWRTSAAAKAPQVTAPSQTEIAALKQELEELKRSVRTSRMRAPAPLASNGLLRGESVAAQLPAPVDSAEPAIVAPEEFEKMMVSRREQAAEQQRARRERLDNNLHAEARDARWAAEATSTVEGWLAEPGLAGYSLTELDCRSSMCRARLSLPDNQKVDDFMVTTQAKMGPFQTASLHVVDNGSGQPELVAYFSRQGQALPQ